jgi:hypothetical protein
VSNETWAVDLIGKDSTGNSKAQMPIADLYAWRFTNVSPHPIYACENEIGFRLLGCFRPVVTSADDAVIA